MRPDFRDTPYGISQVCEVVPFLEQLVLGEPVSERYMVHFASCAHPELLRGAHSISP